MLIQSGIGLKRHSNFARGIRKNYAFTLAEVLITLVIIGVVAALTIPNLMQKYTEQTTVKKVQKFYSNLSNAYSLAIRENGPLEEWGLIDGANRESAEKIYELLFKPYFKIAKNCGASNIGNCVIRTSYKALNNQDGSAGWFTETSRYKLVLDDSSTVVFTSGSPEIKLFYDINGVKAPNKYGIDTFYFLTQNGKVIPCGLPGYTFRFNKYCNRNADSDNRATGLGCTAWLIYKGNMDYLHCDGLTWESHSCKDK